MLILTHFTDKGVLKTGLTPTIKIYDLSDNSLVINGDTCTEIADGAYKYDFAGYDENKDYFIIVDGGAILSDSDRYKIAGSDLGVLERNDVSLDSSLTEIKGAGFLADTDSLKAVKTKTEDLWRETGWALGKITVTIATLFKDIEKVKIELKEIVEKIETIETLAIKTIPDEKLEELLIERGELPKPEEEQK